MIVDTARTSGASELAPRELPDRSLRVAVAHDWMTAWAGSERVVRELLSAFAGARLLTTVADFDVLPNEFRAAEPSFIQRIPGARRHHEWFLPLMPLAWRLRRKIDDVDLVISSSHACAKAVRVSEGTAHLCYCHTPMRYAWDFALESRRFPLLIRPVARALMAWFRRWDRKSASNVTLFVANSSAVAQRILRYYGRRAVVVHPPVRTEFFTPSDSTPREHYLYVGRLTGYKRPDAVVDAFSTLPFPLLIVGDGPLRRHLENAATPNVTFCSNVDDEELRRLYRGARALVYPVDEDFGIAMAEAQACGTPVIALDRGGARDIVVDDLTGYFCDGSADSIRQAVGRIEARSLDARAIRENAERFSESRFHNELEETIAYLLDSGE